MESPQSDAWQHLGSVSKDHHSNSFSTWSVAQPEPYCPVPDPELFGNLAKARSQRPAADLPLPPRTPAHPALLAQARTHAAQTLIDLNP